MYQDKNILRFPETVDAKLQSVLDAHDQGNDIVALQRCISLIDDGCTEAYVVAGAFYEKGGKGVEPDYHKSKFYYEKSIETRGSVEAYLGLARIYYRGLGVNQDYCKAQSLYEKIVRETDSPVANLMLGRILQGGLCGEKDLDKARELYKRAWDSGHILGLTYLGLLEQQTGNHIKGLMLRIKAGYYGFKAASKNPYDFRLRNS